MTHIPPYPKPMKPFTMPKQRNLECHPGKWKADLFGLGSLIHDGQQVVFEQNPKRFDKIWGGLQSISPIEEVKELIPQGAGNHSCSLNCHISAEKIEKNYGWIKWALVALFCRNSIFFCFFKWESGSWSCGNQKKSNDTSCPKTVKTNKLHRQKHTWIGSWYNLKYFKQHFNKQYLKYLTIIYLTM